MIIIYVRNTKGASQLLHPPPRSGEFQVKSQSPNLFERLSCLSDRTLPRKFRAKQIGNIDF